MRARRLAILGTIALLAITAQPAHDRRAAANLGIGAGPFVSGSRIRVRPTGLVGPYDLRLIGPGTLADDVYTAPDVTTTQTAQLIAGDATSMAATTLTIVAPPAATRALIAVATYDDGVVFHDATTFAQIGVFATGGAPSDVAFGAAGNVAATDTAGDDLALARRAPWTTAFVPDVPVGNEIAIDNHGAIFVSDRDVDGNGALTRVTADGSVSRRVTGLTAEGLAIDRARGIVYVGNVNDGTVLAIDARTMAPLRRIPAVPRAFGIALSDDAGTLYVVANQSKQSPFAKAGFVAAIALGKTTHITARSADLRFPLGVAFDAADRRVFVTDESADVVDVLDPITLRATHAPLHTCSTPWKPYYDASAHRLFIPCARADRVDVFDTRTLRRIAGAPFATGGYPLAVATWP